MSRKTFYQYLDNPHQSLDEAEDMALAKILAEVEQLPTNDPGSEYWQQFNHRLQQRLEKQSVKKQTRWWLFPGFAAIAAAMVLAWLFVFQDAYKQPNSLESLSDEGLITISEVYEQAEEAWLSQDLLNDDLDQLFETIETIYQEDHHEDDLELLPTDELLESWEMEG